MRPMMRLCVEGEKEECRSGFLLWRIRKQAKIAVEYWYRRGRSRSRIG
jgi:hypothetical protein